MTNAQIIFNAEQELAKEGKIRYTGRVITMRTTDGQAVEVPETEEIHTFQMWKQMGYMVRKGEHAVAKVTIWKHTGKKVETIHTEDGDKTMVDKGKMFMKTAAFFSRGQVEKVAG